MNKSINEDFIFKLEKEDIEGCLYYIRKKEYSVFQLTDKLGFTILHKLSSLNLYEESLEIIDIFINNLTKYEFTSFINQKNKSGFTALHYASYNGNMKLIKLLINYGSDINLTNNNGLNVLHLSTQGNHSTPLYYFIHKYKMNINSYDKLGNTCLHWACFYNNYKVLNFLLLCDKIKINIKNKNGYTPLHFSVLGKNINAIKKLINCGGDISIKNNENETCLNLAIKKNYKEVIDILIKKNFLIKYNKIFSNFFFIFNIINPILIIFFIIKNFYNNYNLFLYIIWNIILYIMLYYFNKNDFISYLKLKQNNKCDNLLKLIENKNIDINNYCPKCNIYINTINLIKHCYICDKCIEGFDHHCIFIGKCIGKNNKKIFLILLIQFELNFIINFIICSFIEPIFNKKYKIITYKLNNEYTIHILFIINLISFIFGSIIIIPLIKSNFIQLKKEKNINSINSFNIKEKEKNSYNNINFKNQYKFKELLLT